MRQFRILASLVLASGVFALCVASAAGRSGDSGGRMPLFSDLAVGPAADRARMIESLRRHDLTSARIASESAIVDAPMRSESLSLFAAVQRAQGNLPKVQEAYGLAGQLGWRDLGTQTYWLNASLDAGDMNAAAQRLDALLRTRLGLSPYEETLIGMEQRDDGRAALAARLALSPKWARAYLLELPDLMASDRTQALLRLATLTQAKQQGLRADCDVVARVIKVLERRNEIGAMGVGTLCPEQKIVARTGR